MAEEGIKGLRITVIADGSQVKKVFDDAVKGAKSQVVDLKVTAHLDGRFNEILKGMRGQTVDIPVRLQPTRQSIRDFRKDFNERLAKEGGALVPIRARSLTQAQGREISKAIVQSIGSPVVDVVLNWRWGPNGPPPTSFQGTVGGGGGGGFGAEARGPVRPAGGVELTPEQAAFIRQETTRRMAAQSVSGSEQPAPSAPAPAKQRTPRKMNQQRGETDAEYMTRLEADRDRTLAKLESKSADVRARANNRLIQLEKRLGIESNREFQPIAGKSVTAKTGRESTIAPAAEKPGPMRTADGKLMSDAIAEGMKKARQAGTITGPTPGTMAAERSKLQSQMGIKVGSEGVTDLGTLGKSLGITSASGQNSLIERINNRIFGDDPEQVRGFRGGGRVQRSVFSGRDASPFEFVAPPGPSSRRLSEAQRRIVEQGGAIGAFIEEMENDRINRPDFRRDKEELEKFRQTMLAKSPEERFGEGFRRAEEFRQQGEPIKAVFGERRFNEETGRFDVVPAGEKLPTGETSTGFPGAIALRSTLDEMARQRQLPGVGKAAVRYAQSERTDDIRPGRFTQEGLDFISQRDALTAIIQSVREEQKNAAKDLDRKLAAQQGAETTAQALNPPHRRVIPEPDLLREQRLLKELERAPEPPPPGPSRAGETPEEFAARVTPSKSGRTQVRRTRNELETQRARVAALRGPGETDEAFAARTARAQEAYEAAVAEEEERFAKAQKRFEERRAKLPTPLLTQDKFGRQIEPGPFSFLHQRPAAPQAPAQELPDLSDIGISREQVLAAFGHGQKPLAEAAGGVVPPPVPPGMVHAGGGLGEGGGVVPVRVTNFAELRGENGGTFAAGPTAGVPPSQDMLKFFQEAMSGGVEDAMKKLGWNPREEGETSTSKTKSKEPKDVFERGGAAVGLRSALNLGARLGLPPLDAEQLSQIRQQAGLERVRGIASQRDDELTRGLEQSAERARVGVELSPARAVATAAGQIASNLPIFGGRSSLLERARDAAAATSHARQLGEERSQLQATIAVQEHYLAQLPEGTKRHRDLTKSLEATQHRLVDVSGAYEKAAKEATDLNNKVATTSDVVRSFTAGALGTIGGQILFQGLFGAAQGLTQAGIAAAGPVIERQGGFRQSTAERTGALATQVAQTGAPAETLAQQQLAAANFSAPAASQIAGTLASRASIMASNQQAEEQLKLFATAANIRQENAQGLGSRGNGRTRFGSDINLYESTGGFLDTSLGAPGPSTQEALAHAFQESGRQILDQLGVTPDKLRLFNKLTRNQGVSTVEAQQGLGIDFSKAKIPAALDEFEGALKKANSALALHVAATDEDRKQVEATAAALDAADFQELAKAVKQTGIFVSGLSGSAEQQQQTLTHAIENFQRGIGVRHPDQVVAAMSDQIKAQVAGTLKQGQIERTQLIPLQRDLTNLANPVVPLSGQSVLGSPGTGGGFGSDVLTAMFGRQGVSPGAQPQARRAAMATLQAQQLQQQNEAQAQAAIHELFGQNLGPDVEQEYLAVRDRIKDIGSQLAALNQEQVNIQVNLSTRQFDEQLRQVRRSLADARELVSGRDQAGNTDNLGLLERQGLMLSRQSAAVGFQQQQLGLQSQALQLQNQLLGRRSQLLSFQSNELSFQSKQLGFQSQALQLAQNQRQINFQVAAAGFTAPGTTPEERAARIEEAKAEANFAQQQQDIATKQFDIAKQQFGIEQEQFGISKQQFELDGAALAIAQQQYALSQQQYNLSVAQFNNQQAIIDAQNQRAVTDLSIQEKLIDAAKTAQQQLALNEKTIDSLSRSLQAEMQQAGSYLQEASGVATAIAQTSTSLVAQFGGDLDTMLSAYASAWRKFRAQVLGQTPSSTRRQGFNEGEPTRFYAPGAVGMVSAPTHMVVGDAGGEMVAILRNPRNVSAGGGVGGGNISIQITVTGNTVRDDRDLDDLANRLASAVEQKMGRKASVLGIGYGH